MSWLIFYIYLQDRATDRQWLHLAYQLDNPWRMNTSMIVAWNQSVDCRGKIPDRPLDRVGRSGKCCWPGQRPRRWKFGTDADFRLYPLPVFVIQRQMWISLYVCSRWPGSNRSASRDFARGLRDDEARRLVTRREKAQQVVQLSLSATTALGHQEMDHKHLAEQLNLWKEND